MAILLAAICLLLAACGPATIGGPSAATVRVTGHVLAGPTCPVERNPPDPACAPRPVQNAVVVVVDAASGETAAETRTGGDGAFAVDVAPGSYRLEGGAGMPGIGPPAPVAFEAVEGAGPVVVDLAVDTGIR